MNSPSNSLLMTLSTFDYSSSAIPSSASPSPSLSCSLPQTEASVDAIKSRELIFSSKKTTEPIRSLTEQRRFLNAFSIQRYRLMAEFALLTGLRSNDLLSIRLEQLEQPQFTIFETRTKNIASFEWSAALNLVRGQLLHLCHCREYKGNDFVFQCKYNKGSPMNPKTFLNVVKIAAKKANLDGKIGTQSLRKTYLFNKMRDLIEQQQFNESVSEREVHGAS
ncbi:hypothetical protein RCL1_009024 [Eukaryota sp. TZLM3-RCL]